VKILFITCFLVIFFIDNHAKSETIVASIIHNHKKQLSSTFNFDIIRLNKKNLLFKQKNSLENNIQNILKIDKDKNINEVIKYLVSLRQDAFISFGKPNHELIRKRNEEIRIENQLNSGQRIRKSRGVNFKIISISF